VIATLPLKCHDALAVHLLSRLVPEFSNYARIELRSVIIRDNSDIFILTEKLSVRILRPKFQASHLLTILEGNFENQACRLRLSFLFGIVFRVRFDVDRLRLLPHWGPILKLFLNHLV
jgi:hypothetical protein